MEKVCGRFWRILWQWQTQKPLEYQGVIGSRGGADGNDLTSFDRTLSSTGYPASKTKMLLTQHLTYFKPVAFAPAKAGSTLMA